MRIILLIAFATMATACAGRAPAPVAIVQPQDRFMDCAAITAEAQANTKRVQELGSEEGGKVAQNIAAGVVGLFIWPVWFAMDFQGAASKEVAALQARQQYLGTMAEQKGCTTAQPAPVPPPPPPAAGAPPHPPDRAKAHNSPGATHRTGLHRSGRDEASRDRDDMPLALNPGLSALPVTTS